MKKQNQKKGLILRSHGEIHATIFCSVAKLWVFLIYKVKMEYIPSDNHTNLLFEFILYMENFLHTEWNITNKYLIYSLDIFKTLNTS